MKAIYKRELRSYFTSMTGCVFAAFVTIVGGVYFMVYNLNSGYPFFSYSLSGVIFALLICVPMLSMKCFAEERKHKTEQLWLTSPVSLTEVILGKYFAMISVFGIPCLIFCLFPIIIKLQGNAHLLVDYSSILAFFLLGCVYFAIGMFLSSLTESLIIAAVSTCGVLFFLYMMDNLLAYVPTSALSGLIIILILITIIAGIVYYITKNPVIAGGIEAIGLIAGIGIYIAKSTLYENLISNTLEHLVLTDVFYNFAQNYIFDISGLFYYISIIIFFVFLTIQSFQKRRWS